MTQDDLNKISLLLDQKLADSEQRSRKEVDKALESVTGKVDMLWEQTVELTENMAEVQDTLASHTKVLASHTEMLASHTSALKIIITNTEDNQNSIGKLNKRVHRLEDRAGIVSPPELTII